MLATGLRVPLTAATDLFAQAVAAGREMLSLHTYGLWRAQTPPAAKPRIAPNPPQITTPLPDEARSISHDPSSDTLI